MTTKKLTRRQARWAEFLSQYDFKVAYRLGAANGKADALTRREARIREAEDPHLYQTVLPRDKISDDVAEELELAALMASIPLTDRILVDNDNSLVTRAIREAMKTTPRPRSHEGYQLDRCSENEQGALLYDAKIIVPTQELQVELIKAIHEGREVGHGGAKATQSAISQRFFIPGATKLVEQFVRNCHTCRRSKPPTRKPAGLLRPLPIPQQPWLDIAMDFVTGLPLSHGCNAVLNVIDRLSKERHFIPLLIDKESKGATAEATAELLYKNVWKYHGFLETITSNRGTQFTSAVWQQLCHLTGTQAKLSTSFHP